MKHYFIPHFILLLALLASACQNAVEQPVKPQTLKIGDVIKAFKAENLPLGQLEFFNAKSDPQQLLGKPNQYTEKAVWQTTEKITHSVEAFAVEADLQARKAMIEAAAAAAAKPGAPPLPQIFAHKNLLLVLHGEMLPETAAKFEKALKTL